MKTPVRLLAYAYGVDLQAKSRTKDPSNEFRRVGSSFASLALIHVPRQSVPVLKLIMVTLNRSTLSSQSIYVIASVPPSQYNCDSSAAGYVHRPCPTRSPGPRDQESRIFPHEVTTAAIDATATFMLVFNMPGAPRLKHLIREARAKAPFYSRLYETIADDLTDLELSDLPRVVHSDYWSAFSESPANVLTAEQSDGIWMRTGGMIAKE